MPLAVLSYTVEAYSAETIANIYFSGNAKTEERILLQEMVIAEGDAVDVKKIEDSIQFIRNLNLFEIVSYRLEQQPSSEQVDLTITVKERYFLFVLPHIKFDDENHVETGMRMKLNNVFGLNHTLGWRLIDIGSDFGVDEYKNEFDYTMPRIFYSSYQLTLQILKGVIVNEDPVFGPQEQINENVGVELFKWLKKKGVSSGYFVGAGITNGTRSSNAILPTGISKGSNEALVYSARGGFQDVDEYLYNRNGYFLEYIIKVASEILGADRDNGFVSHQFKYRRYHSLNKRLGRSVNVLLRVATSNNDNLGESAFYLGGNGSLRGYKKNTFRGNAVVNSSLEYLTVFDENPHIRKVFFVDFGAVYPNFNQFNLSDFKVGAGAGIRIKARKFININLRLDLAYGFDTDEFRVTLGSRHAF